MSRTYKIGVFLFIFFLAYACGTKKNTFISRNYHALTTKFNILFNGNEYFKKGIEEINAKYEDDFWELLPIEPIKFDEDKIEALERPSATTGFGGGPGENFNTGNSSKEKPVKSASNFERAEEKAVKAIQRHSMNINGRERNRQIDDAYLLLGKSRYYSQRFIPAIDAFNYIITNYPGANLINETKIWRAKSNIRIDNEEFAIESLNILLNNEESLSDEIREQAHTAIAMAYSKIDSTQLVIEHLKLAIRTQKNRNQTARNMFILGQIYALENQKDSAVMAFQKLVNFKKSPYKYRIYANMEIAKNASGDSLNVALIKRFGKLIKNRDNRPYLDGLYFQTGVLQENRDSVGKAIAYYNKSLRTPKGTAKQKTYGYERLGNIYFKNTEYLLASSYYDSVLKVAKDSNNLRIRRIKRRYKSLESLIAFEKTLKHNDSILKLVSLSKEEQIQFFEKYVAEIKAADEALAQQQLNNLSFGSAFGSGSQQSFGNKGKWYFYNTQSMGFGEVEFQRIWGNRPLEDNWRWSDKTKINLQKDDTKDTVTVDKSKYDVNTYISKIPTEKKEIDSLIYFRNEALFELGLIYKEQFKKPDASTNYLERLLENQPDSSLVLPANYHLYQLYNNANDLKSEKYKNYILDNYADTKFAQLIKFPGKEIEEEEKELSETEKFYKQMYYLYKEDEFENVLCEIDQILPTIANSKLIPKFELLKAYVIGKYQGEATYKEALEYVAIQYPRTEEGKKAKEILIRLKK
ncbi:MAG: tetratricopeptide repeat protein [Flavobacteriaceae bacterium]|nr:MAG: tetratricopeptide repeat protein [Flavobacteriaceae bacterium]